MKMNRVRTLRGRIDIASGTTGKDQLIVDDGLLNRGYRVTGFFVWGASGGDTSFMATLSMNPKTLTGEMDSGNNSQIGWTFLGGGAGASIDRIIDPDHVIVRDLYITIERAGGAENFNYMIVVEEYSITDEEAIINIIKEGSQSL